VAPGVKLRPEDRGKRAIPAVPLRKVNQRHYLRRFSPTARAKAKTTLILPGFEPVVDADRDAINAGEATWDPGDASWTIEGRVYRDEGTGTFYPVAGPGFVTVAKEVIVLLAALKRYDGDTDGALIEIDRLGTRIPFRPEDVAEAISLWAHVREAGR